MSIILTFQAAAVVDILSSYNYSILSIIGGSLRSRNGGSDRHTVLTTCTSNTFLKFGNFLLKYCHHFLIMVW